jgi:hypothetical protein
MVELKDNLIYYKFGEISKVIGLFYEKEYLSKYVVKIPELGVSWIRSQVYKEFNIKAEDLPPLALVLRIDCEKKWLLSKIKYGL